MIADYAYEYYFEMDNVHKDLLIVEDRASVTVEDDMIIIGDTAYQIHTSDFDKEKFEIHESICTQPTLAFGYCNSSTLKFSLGESDIPDLTGKKIKVYLYFDHDVNTLFEVGHYKVTSDKHALGHRKRDIIAYDALYDIRTADVTNWYKNNIYTNENVTLTVNQLINALLQYLKVNRRIDVGYDSANPISFSRNGYTEIKGTITSDNITAGMLLERICELTSSFGRIDRSGKLVFIKELSTRYSRIVLENSQFRNNLQYSDHFSPMFDKIAYYRSGNLIAVAGNNASDYATYAIKDNPLIADRELIENSDIENIIYQTLAGIRGTEYCGFKLQKRANLCQEIGDSISIEQLTVDGSPFRSYILERTIKGIQAMTDTLEAKYSDANNASSSGLSSYIGTGGYVYSNNQSSQQSNPGFYSNENLPEIMRNFGYRLLDEPSDVSCTLDETTNSVTLCWTDPDDISTEEPVPAEWKGTVVVRKSGSEPKNIWDGTIVVETTLANNERDIYSENGYVDTGLESNVKYYYGIFPYTDDGINKDYRWTKIVTANTNTLIDAPVIRSATASGRTIDVAYYLPTGTYSSRKIVYKVGSIPENESDGTAVNIGAGAGGEGHSPISGLTPNTLYYFIIFDEDSNHRKATSNVVTATTGDYIKQSVMSLLTDHSAWLGTSDTNWREGGTITHNSDGTITITTTPTTSFPVYMHGKAAVTPNKVNISGWDRLCVEFKRISGTQVNWMGIFAAPNNVFKNEGAAIERTRQDALQNWQPNVKYSVSLTGLSASELYLGVGCGNNSANGSETIVVKDLWLEKG